ncbi:hypothetical protein B0T21DRAFT_312842 [Apiosordaria backusii]|uniref:J domain-containing protein n=1 Tax=Apiosordaria backusii TaxID=314023 RepID=A0AA40BK05_9PEZI|nr:hypothetical protein B0T21DRAFT_312842 [Apiosordaria backusii]
MSGFLSLIAWSFLPNLVTGWTQTLLYSIFIRAGDPHPTPGTPRWANHRRKIHILVVTLYLLYTIYEADHDIQSTPTFYSSLGVPLTATEKEIKSRFRRLAALFHPDKIKDTTQPISDANTYFVHLQLAQDTLTNPTKRFAYDRFGPEAITTWQHCSSVADYVYRGFKSLIPYYTLFALSMYAFGLLGYLDWGKFERWLILALLFLFESTSVTRPHPPLFLTKFINPLVTYLPNRQPYLQFQAVTLAKKLALTTYLAFSQIGPLITADTTSGNIVVDKNGKGAGNEEQALRQGLERLETSVKRLDVDATNLLQLELAPFAGDEKAMGETWKRVREWLVHNTIRSDPMVRDAMGRSLARRRGDAPVGARGTR